MSDDGRMVDGSKCIAKSSGSGGGRVFHNIHTAREEAHHFNHSSDIGSSHFHPSDMIFYVISAAAAEGRGEERREEEGREEETHILTRAHTQ